MKPVSEVLESLLSGSFICPTTDRDAYKTIQDDRCRSEINTVLMHMGRELNMTSRTSAYYVTYKTIDASNHNKVRSMISEVFGLIRPVVRFVAMVGDASIDERILVAGDELSLPHLVLQIQQSTTLTEMLDSTYRHPKVRRNRVRESIPEKLEVVMEFLVKEGLAKLVSKDRQLYMITGKLDFIYEVLDFIDINENVIEQVNKENEAQGEFVF